jgi:predicted small secreted protein
MTSSFKRAATLLAGAAILALTVSACNTVEGAGRDVKSTGKAIERTAEKNK